MRSFGSTALYVAVITALVQQTSAGRKLVGATNQEIETQLRKSKYTADAMRRLQDDGGDVEPQQLHLSLTGDVTSMMIMFVTMAKCEGSVTFWPSVGASNPVTVSAVPSTYTAGVFGWSGVIHTAIMQPLTASTKYTYTVSCNNGTVVKSSEQRNFTSAMYPNAAATTYIAVTADMGTIVPLGWQVAERIGEDHTESGRPFDMVMVAGDLSYATIDPPNNEVEWTWDAFGVQNEIFTSTAPYMTTVGNHEHVPGTLTNASGSFEVPFAAYMARYHMPWENSNGNNSLWYSYDFGNVHYTSINTEDDYSVGSAQWNWVKNDLAAANARRNITPFLIFVLHRPILSVDADEYTSHCPGAPLSAAFEPLLLQYGVDLVIQGHQHEYERTHSVYNGTVVTLPTNGTYTNPRAPIYVLQGTSGAMQEEKYVSPIPLWSAVHMSGVYGYARMTVTAGSTLDYEFVDTNGDVQDAFKIVKT